MEIDIRTTFKRNVEQCNLILEDIKELDRFVSYRLTLSESVLEPKPKTISAKVKGASDEPKTAPKRKRRTRKTKTDEDTKQD